MGTGEALGLERKFKYLENKVSLEQLCTSLEVMRWIRDGDDKEMTWMRDGDEMEKRQYI